MRGWTEAGTLAPIGTPPSGLVTCTVGHGMDTYNDLYFLSAAHFLKFICVLRTCPIWRTVQPEAHRLRLGESLFTRVARFVVNVVSRGWEACSASVLTIGCWENWSTLSLSFSASAICSFSWKWLWRMWNSGGRWHGMANFCKPPCLVPVTVLVSPAYC